MKLSYLIKQCTPVWARIIDPASTHFHNEHTDLHEELIDYNKDNQRKVDNNHYHNHSSDPEISSIHANASEVKQGGLFIAIKGFKADGHNYIAQAVANGAVAIVTERKIEKKELVTLFASSLVKPVIVEVKDSRKAMSSIAARFYGNPSDSMVLIGITGTNGKTTTAFLIESIFKAAGYNTGVIGTVNYRFANQTFDNPVTTPDSIDLHRILAQMRDANVTHVVMEVSSHAVDLHRVRDCEFDVGVFTNLTQDHLDYHKTMSAYFACKKSFFTRQLKRGKKAEKSVAVINIDDFYGEKIATELGIEVVTTTTIASKEKIKNTNHNIFSGNITDDISGLKGDIYIRTTNHSMNRESSTITFPFDSKLTGQFNLENILSATGAAHAVGVELKSISKGIEVCNGVPGRLERVEPHGKEYSFLKRHVFVDYAHTPDAIESILKTLKMRAPARLITVFGCGGDRDRTKRPIMGEIAYRYSDITIITSDNPRTEDPDAIISQIVKGIEDVKPCGNRDTSNRINREKQLIIEPDRAKALELSVNISKSNDIIVAAGKGHETYQITAQGKIEFDDRIILKKALTKLTKEQPANRNFMPIKWSCYDIISALEISNLPPITSSANSTSNSELYSDRFTSISTDSRAIKNDELFVSLKGERFDGHNFVFELIRQGVKGFVVKKGYYNNLTDAQKDEVNRESIYLFEVPDTLKALGMLARFQKIRSGVKVVAITGSNGKTTTRKMTASIFEQHFKTLSTQGNLNNEIGVPLTLLRLSKDHEWAVIEMGMNHPGEISRLSKIACPDIAIITNTTDAHLEGLGTVEDVARAKAEIIDGMNQNSTIIINRDDPRWEIISKKVDNFSNISSKIFFGLDNVCASFNSDIKDKDTSVKFCISAKEILFNQDSTDFSLRIDYTDENLKQTHKCYSGLTINTPAPFMLNNALAATVAAFVAGVPQSSIRTGLLMFKPVVGRMNILNIGQQEGMTQTSVQPTISQQYKDNSLHDDNRNSSKANWLHIINDTYNANPGSVKAALETLKQLSRTQESIAVLGDMLELGEKSEQLHYEIGQMAVNAGIARLYTHGDMSINIVKGAQNSGLSKSNIFHGTKEEIIEALLKYIQEREDSPDTNRAESIDKLENAKKSIWILIKGSRGMKMEQVVEALVKFFN